MLHNYMSDNIDTINYERAEKIIEGHFKKYNLDKDKISKEDIIRITGKEIYSNMEDILLIAERRLKRKLTERVNIFTRFISMR